jgi:hypothetical protein
MLARHRYNESFQMGILDIWSVIQSRRVRIAPIFYVLIASDRKILMLWSYRVTFQVQILSFASSLRRCRKRFNLNLEAASMSPAIQSGNGIANAENGQPYCSFFSRQVRATIVP